MGKTILVIDDEEHLCEILKEKFEQLGHHVLTALEGAEGLLKTVEGKPDCVILDIYILKGEGGLSYIRKLRSYCHTDTQEQARIRETPVVVLTGKGNTMKPLFELEKISGFLEKPFDFGNLREKVEQVLRTR
jgi:two-component system alkaline phosphatase synthesis response regulator PhoP